MWIWIHWTFRVKWWTSKCNRIEPAVGSIGEVGSQVNKTTEPSSWRGRHLVRTRFFYFSSYRGRFRSPLIILSAWTEIGEATPTSVAPSSWQKFCISLEQWANLTNAPSCYAAGPILFPEGVNSNNSKLGLTFQFALNWLHFKIKFASLAMNNTINSSPFEIYWKSDI